MATRADIPWSDTVFSVLDLEMTGLDVERDEICEVGLVRIQGGKELDRFHSLVRPNVPVSPTARLIHHISDEELAAAPSFGELADTLLERLEGTVLVGHHVDFDRSYLTRAMMLNDRVLPELPSLDTLELSRSLLALRSHRLGSVCAVFGVDTGTAHRALDDAEATSQCLLPLLELLDPAGDSTVAELLEIVAQLAPTSAFRQEQMALFERAHRERRTVVVEYLSRQDSGGYEVTRREFEIWKLAPPRMQGFCHLRDGERVFRLERVRAAWEGERVFEIPKFRERI